MGTLTIKDESGKVIATIKGAGSQEEAMQEYERRKAQRNAQEEAQSKWPQQYQDTFTDSAISSLPIPGIGIAKSAIKNVVSGVGPTEKGKAMLKEQDLAGGFWDLIKAGSANVGNTLSLGAVPAALARAGLPKMDEDVAKSREYFGPWGDFALSAGVGTLNPLNKLMPFTRMAGEYAPGAWEATKRIAAGGADDVLNQIGLSTIRGENYGPADVWDSLKSSVQTGGLFELLAGGKRKVGKMAGEWGMSPDQRKRDTAIEYMENMRRGAPPPPAWRETVRDDMGPGFNKTLNRMADMAPEEYRRVQDAAIDRMNETSGRVRVEGERIFGEPLTGDKRGQMQAQEARDAAFGHSPEYLPAFIKNPTIPNKIRLQMDLGEVNDQGRPKKTGVTIPKGYEAAIGEPKAYTDYAAAKAEAQDYADRKAREMGRAPPTETEVMWYTIRNLENKKGTPAETTGNHLGEIFRNQFTDIGNVIKSQADLHSQSRAAEAGGRMWENRAEGATPEAQRARATPEGQKAFEKAFFQDLVSRTQGGTSPNAREGVAMPRDSAANRKTAEDVLGPQRAADLMAVLRREWGKLNLDKPLAEHKPNLPGGDLARPASLLRKSASSGARILAGAITGGPAGLLWALPGAVSRFKIDPNLDVDPAVARHIVEQANQPQLSPKRKKNALETKFNSGFTTPAIMAATRQERDKRRYDNARQRELNEKFVRKTRGD